MRTNSRCVELALCPVELSQLHVVVHFHVRMLTKSKPPVIYPVAGTTYFRLRDDRIPRIARIEERKHVAFAAAVCFARSRQRPRTRAWSILVKRVSSMPIRLNRLYVTLARAYVCYMYPFTYHSSSVIAVRDHTYVLVFAAMGHGERSMAPVEYLRAFLRHCTKLCTPLRI